MLVSVSLADTTSQEVPTVPAFAWRSWPAPRVSGCRDRDFRDDLWNKLLDEALLVWADLAESLTQMNAGNVRRCPAGTRFRVRADPECPAFERSV